MDDAAKGDQPKPVALLLKLRQRPNGDLPLDVRHLAAGAEELFRTTVSGASLGLSAEGEARWVRVDLADHPWEQAHAMMRQGFALGDGDLLAAEPDFEQSWPVGPIEETPAARGAAPEGPRGQNGKGGRAVGPGLRWHLEPDYSDLAAAHKSVAIAKQAQVLVAHLDTGYDPTHNFRPATIAQDLERSFVSGDRDGNKAHDPLPHALLRTHGHGTGTIGILAGPEIGGAPGVRVLPIRIADGVVRFTTSSMVKGFRHALKSNADVLSMSMGGLASGALADIINECYRAGMVMVTAAGNTFSPIPLSIVYPARFRRVIAACGIMANHQPYSGLDAGTMEGCYGPDSKMDTALSAYTPNIPWARLGAPKIVDEDGGGTSSATPQIAAAAALWIAKNLTALPARGNWQRGEAVRQALFRTATLAAEGARDEKLGWGALRARALLQQTPATLGPLSPAPVADASWDWLKLLTGRGSALVQASLTPAERLLGLELMQLVQRDSTVWKQIRDPDAGPRDDKERRAFLEEAASSKFASRTLKVAIHASLGQRSDAARPPTPPPPPRTAGPAAAGPPPTGNAPAGNPLPPPRSQVPAPLRRRLRIFALDPSLGASLNSYEDQIATIDIRNEPDLKPGPVGDYLEVVDVDPASDRVYRPVDLNDPHLLMQDGLMPNEGNPAFHQQMVYAVAMRTIEAFELALGRKALWARYWSKKSGERDRFVRRLRIYPHGLRQRNAYYSAEKRALLFGYFLADSQISDLTPPGTTVFGCLSADIIAHETTHALLDGQYRSFRENSNPDMLAFHEAFADIVALFQQFTYADLVQREIARSRGDLKAATLLGGLAKQFGEGTGRRGPLRTYPDLPDGVSYATTFQAHERGAILVAAIYRAFLAIVERRMAGLVRLATGGSGMLPAGDLHPDLAQALTREVCRAARHVMGMCIRAIDYCPPVDVSFGDYLRALITADLMVMPDDPLGYRVAFLEAFRRLEILPRDLRTVSADTLSWNEYGDPDPPWLHELAGKLYLPFFEQLDRQEVFRRTEINRKACFQVLSKAIAADPGLCASLGILDGTPPYDEVMNELSMREGSRTTFSVPTLRIARRLREDGEMTAELVTVIRQRRPMPFDTGGSAAGGQFWYRGGVTLIVDISNRDKPRLRYAIRQAITSQKRLARQRAWLNGDSEGALRATYFGSQRDASGLTFDDREPFALAHALRA